MATSHISLAIALTLASLVLTAASFAPSRWSKATATFYGPIDGSHDMGGACGYENLDKWTTALSTTLFNDGAACGQCYKIMCDHWTDPTWCKKGRVVTVTSTNFCPPNYSLPNDDGGWCNPPRQHFDMSRPAWEQIGIYRGGIIPIVYQRVPCAKQGGVRFTMKGNDYFYIVLISNVGGAGSIESVWIKGSGTRWMVISRNWGANWQFSGYLKGQALSFTVTTTDGVTRVFNNAVPSGWSFGQTFSTGIQF